MAQAARRGPFSIRGVHIMFTLETCDAGHRNAYSMNARDASHPTILAAVLFASRLRKFRSVAQTIVAIAFGLAALDAQANSTVGAWSWPIRVPTLPIHNNLLPDGRILMWQHGHSEGIDPTTGKKYVKDNPAPIVWDPKDGSYVSVEVPDHLYRYDDNTTPPIQTDEIYCSGQTILADGRVLVTGGHSNRGETEFHGSPRMRLFDYRNMNDPITHGWSLGADMNAGRWYPTNVPLAGGKALVLGGYVTENNYNQTPQVYDPVARSWRTLSTASSAPDLPLYPWLYPAPGGKVFYAGPRQETRFLDLAGTGAWSQPILARFGPTRQFPSGLHRGASVLYDEGKILNVGGTPGEFTPPTNTAEVIDLKTSAPSWRQVGSLNYPRQFLNATLLPDGKVLVTGGTTSPGWIDYTGTVYAAEMWDPATQTWTVMASMTQPRLHHAMAMLLPDGRVLVGGGGQTEIEGESEYRDIEFYSPPYLFKGDRPVISAAPATISYGQQFSVGTPDKNINKVVLIRLGSVTHGFNQNQAVSNLKFKKGKGGLTVDGPVDSNVVPPGHYMLFIVDGGGVPAVAKIVKLQ